MRVTLSLVLLVTFLFLSSFNFQAVAVESSEVHDVAVSNVTAWPAFALPISVVHVNVTVENQGTCSENFSLIVYAENMTIQTVNIVDLAPAQIKTLTFKWELHPFRVMIFPPPRPYDKPMVQNVTIWAEADVVAGEADTSDNVYIDGKVTIIWWLTDVDGDGDIDIYDIIHLVSRYGSELGDPGYDPLLDFNQNGKIGIFDVVISVNSYGPCYM
jgi:hypothetical protein